MQILNAYLALAAISTGVIAYDAYDRTEHVALSAAEVAFASQSKLPDVASKYEATHAEVAPLAETAAASKSAQAPYGVFFLKNAVEVPTADGSRTFRAGAKVQLVRRMDGKMKVTRDGTDFLVDESELTSDAVSAVAGEVVANQQTSDTARLYSQQVPK